MGDAVQGRGLGGTLARAARRLGHVRPATAQPSPIWLVSRFHRVTMQLLTAQPPTSGLAPHSEAAFLPGNGSLCFNGSVTSGCPALSFSASHLVSHRAAEFDRPRKLLTAQPPTHLALRRILRQLPYHLLYLLQWQRKFWGASDLQPPSPLHFGYSPGCTQV